MGKIAKKKKIIICLFVLGTLAVSSPALALLVQWPDSPIPGGVTIDGNTQLHELIAYIYEWAITLGGLALFVVLIYAGVEYLTSAGKPETMRSAKDRIKDGVIGLILLLSIWLILNTINPALTSFEPLEFDFEDFLHCEIESGGNCTDDDDCIAELGDYAVCEIDTCSLDTCKQRFGEYYNCENERCVLDEDAWLAGFTPNQCASITAWKEDRNWTGDGAVNGKRVLLPGDKYRIGGRGIQATGQYLDKEGEPFFAQIEFPVNPNTGKLYDNCVAQIELYKGRSAFEKCASDRDRIQITATRHPDDDGAHPCGSHEYCKDVFGGEYMCEDGICAIVQRHVPDQLYDEYVRCIEYRVQRMPF